MLLTAAALLFDVDGTLVDSLPAVERSWRRWADEHGVDQDELFADFHGRRAVDLVARWIGREGFDAAVARQAEIELADTEGVHALPGALDLLRSAPAGAWAAVTSADRALMTARLAAAGLPEPVVVVTAEDVSAGKPDPQGYLAGAARLGAEPARCVVLEDAPAGVAAGLAAGATVVAVATTHRPDELAAAHVVVADLRAVRLDSAGPDGLVLHLDPLPDPVPATTG